MSRAAAVLLLCASSLLPPLHQARAQPWAVEEMMAGMAAVRTERAYFEEEKVFAILREPLRSTGQLAYRAPDYLLKETLTPSYERLEVDGAWLMVDEGQSRQRLHLSGYPLLQALVEAVRSTMAGDLEKLAQFYAVDFDGRRDGWTLRLTPLHPEARRYLDRVVVRGRDNRIDTVETLEADGDGSVMRVAIISIETE